jgi:tripartite-type tricarboxylate transporter receptor subunit TctC
VGTQAAASAPADGYTLLVATNGNMVVTPLVYAKLNYDVKRDFKVLSILAEAPTVVVVNPAVQARNLREFGAWIKANPARANFASLGQGNALYIATRILEADLGLSMSEIPYKGSAPALTALMAGDVPMFVDLASTSIPLVRAGKLRALAVPHRQRLSWFPDVPTFAEEGLTPLHAPSWMGLAFVTGTPPAAIAAVQAAARKVAADPRLKPFMDGAGLVPVPDADDVAGAERYLDGDRERWGAFVRRFRIKLD